MRFAPVIVVAVVLAMVIGPAAPVSPPPSPSVPSPELLRLTHQVLNPQSAPDRIALSADLQLLMDRYGGGEAVPRVKHFLRGVPFFDRLKMCRDDPDVLTPTKFLLTVLGNAVDRTTVQAAAVMMALMAESNLVRDADRLLSALLQRALGQLDDVTARLLIRVLARLPASVRFGTTSGPVTAFLDHITDSDDAPSAEILLLFQELLQHVKDEVGLLNDLLGRTFPDKADKCTSFYTRVVRVLPESLKLKADTGPLKFFFDYVRESASSGPESASLPSVSVVHVFEQLLSRCDDADAVRGLLYDLFQSPNATELAPVNIILTRHLLKVGPIPSDLALLFAASVVLPLSGGSRLSIYTEAVNVLKQLLTQSTPATVRELSEKLAGKVPGSDWISLFFVAVAERLSSDPNPAAVATLQAAFPDDTVTDFLVEFFLQTYKLYNVPSRLRTGHITFPTDDPNDGSTVDQALIQRLLPQLAAELEHRWQSESLHRDIVARLSSRQMLKLLDGMNLSRAAFAPNFVEGFLLSDGLMHYHLMQRADFRREYGRIREPKQSVRILMAVARWDFDAGRIRQPADFQISPVWSITGVDDRDMYRMIKRYKAPADGSDSPGPRDSVAGTLSRLLRNIRDDDHLLALIRAEKSSFLPPIFGGFGL